MGFEWWDNNGQQLLYMGALAAALTAIYKLYGWLWPKLKFIHRKIQWAMSDENDHTIIMERLDSIAGKLERNDGSHIPDSLDRIEKQLKFQGARQQAALHMRPNPVFETDHSGEVVFVNNAYKQAFGIDANDAEGMGWVNIIPSNLREALVAKWFRAVDDKRTFDECTELMGVGNKRMKCHVIAYVIRDTDSDGVLGHHGEVIFNEPQ